MPFLPGCLWHVTKETKHTADVLVWNASVYNWLKCRTSIPLEILTFAKVWFGRKMSHFFLWTRKSMGREEKGRRIGWKNQAVPIFTFPPQCRTEEQLPPSPEDPASHKQSSLKSQWAAASNGAPMALSFPQSSAVARRDWPYSSSIPSQWETNPAASDLLLQFNFGFISVSVLGQKFVLLENSSLAFLDSFAYHIVTPRAASFKKLYYLFEGRGKKAINANCHMVVSKPCVSLLVCWNGQRWRHSRMLKGIVLRCWKKQPVKMTGFLLCPKRQHLNTQYAQRWLSQGSVMICETNFY